MAVPLSPPLASVLPTHTLNCTTAYHPPTLTTCIWCIFARGHIGSSVLLSGASAEGKSWQSLAGGNPSRGQQLPLDLTCSATFDFGSLRVGIIQPHSFLVFSSQKAISKVKGSTSILPLKLSIVRFHRIRMFGPIILRIWCPRIRLQGVAMIATDRVNALNLAVVTLRLKWNLTVVTLRLNLAQLAGSVHIWLLSGWKVFPGTESHRQQWLWWFRLWVWGGNIFIHFWRPEKTLFSGRQNWLNKGALKGGVWIALHCYYGRHCLLIPRVWYLITFCWWSW